ncbi:MAG TPA: ABC transporter ATP-binding protein, partial [Gemmataceae bacterium]
LVSRGRIPGFAELDAEQRAAYLAGWRELSDEQRQAAVARLGAGAEGLVPASRLAAAEPDPPLDAIGHELRWRAYVWLLLRDRVGEVAADSYLPPAEAGRGPEELLGRAVAWDPAGYGMLSPVVRYAHEWTGPVLGWAARWNPWAWNPAGGTPNLRYLTGLFLAALALVLGRAGLMSLTSYAAANATSEAVTRLRRAIYHHTYRLGTLAVRALGPSEAISLFTRHIEAVHDALHVWLTKVFRYPVQFALLLMVALALHFWLALTFVLAALLVWFLGGQLAILFRARSRFATRRAANRLALLQESLMMMRLVKSYLMEIFNQSRLERQLADYDQASRQRFRGESLARGVFVLLASLGVVVLLFIAGRAVLGGGVGVANLVALAVVLVSLFFPVQGWLEARRFLRRGRESAAAVFEFLDRRGDVAQVVDAEFLAPMSRQLEFADVSLREPGTGRMLLQNVSFTVRAGQRVCLVGPDDAELYAVAYLIPRFLDPTGGEIRIDGKNIRWVTHDSLRSQIALVMQHNLIFNDTVANNIGCGDASYSLPQIIEAAKLAHAHQFIQKLPAGYETPVGELGFALSVSEQFRIALARAILRDPALLIIEEPHRHLDEDSKSLLDDTLRRFLPGRTVIFLPHRVSTIRHSDRVFLIHRGRLVAAGEHRELLDSDPLYKHLHYTEFNEFAERV